MYISVIRDHLKASTATLTVHVGGGGNIKMKKRPGRQKLSSDRGRKKSELVIDDPIDSDHEEIRQVFNTSL